jgi:2-polyprenyl-3-methyl-5-hydroxy-6-metoxy-1,4-benzoquinol methylase
MLEEDPKLQSVVDTLFQEHDNLKVLEIGCGSCSHIELPEKSYIVGIDISDKQLQRNNLLSEKILADVETYNLPESSFDLIVCWWILEHLPHPEKALENCQKALKKDGAMILAVPNVMSVKGLITKYTPHWFHVFVYRYIFGEKHAGTDDQQPFQTFLRYSLRPDSIKSFADSSNLSIERFHLYENPRQKKLRAQHWLIDTSWKFLGGITKALSFGKVDADLTDFIVVLKK